ncbi:17656_t:CDS:2 [Gigaspora margarita]|uniref:17656_t:CDS:1 n=1 Tax=Gigaspora margarita TaxID=4874 RepID=A0ABN7UAT9_GIGMA|nr:17656_t:CDS:2 [Gigaspora margarita]
MPMLIPNNNEREFTKRNMTPIISLTKQKNQTLTASSLGMTHIQSVKLIIGYTSSIVALL